MFTRLRDRGRALLRRGTWVAAGVVTTTTAVYLGLLLTAWVPVPGMRAYARLLQPGQPFDVGLAAQMVLVVGVFLLGLALLFRGFGRADDRGSWYVLSSPGSDSLPGSLTVSVSRRSIDGLVVRACRTRRGVVQVTPEVALAADGWDVRCRVHTWPGDALVGLVAELQSEITRVLEEHTTGSSGVMLTRLASRWSLRVSRIEVLSSGEPNRGTR